MLINRLTHALCLESFLFLMFAAAERHLGFHSYFQLRWKQFARFSSIVCEDISIQTIFSFSKSHSVCKFHQKFGDTSFFFPSNWFCLLNKEVENKQFWSFHPFLGGRFCILKRSQCPWILSNSLAYWVFF